MALRDWMQLTLTDGLGSILCQRLVASCGSAAEACQITEQRLRSIEGIGDAKASRIYRAMKAAAGETDIELQRAGANGATIICPDDADYPLLLREIPDPPGVLYLKGSLQPRDLHGVAIVGSRKCSFYGREQAERFGALLGARGSPCSAAALEVSIRQRTGARCHTRWGEQSPCSVAGSISCIRRKTLRCFNRLPSGARC